MMSTFTIPPASQWRRWLPQPPVLAARAEILRHESSIDAMGTTFTIAAYSEDRQKLITAVDLALEEARRLDHKLSNYRPESEWSEVNHFAAERPVV